MVSLVLIDTWWNVNLKYKFQSHLSNTVLIDTWWNVNQTTGISADPTASFNRYMVECE